MTSSDLILHILSEKQAHDVRCFQFTHSLFDCGIIATGRSVRHVNSLADSVCEYLKAHRQPILGVEQSPSWVLIDTPETVVHIMEESTRAYYHLEEHWASMIESP